MWRLVIAMSLGTLGCAQQPSGSVLGSTTQGGGESGCPPGASELQGAPPAPSASNNFNPQPVPGSQYEAVHNAIEGLWELEDLDENGEPKGFVPAKRRSLAGCLRAMLKQGNIYSGKQHESWTLPDGKAGWQGDRIITSIWDINAAIATETDDEEEQENDMKILMAKLAHEAVHAEWEGPCPNDNAGIKNQEKEAVEQEKAVLAACGMQDRSRYKFLCAWLQSLCDDATNDPTGNNKRKCAKAAAQNAGGGGHRSYYVAHSATNTVYVATRRNDGSDRSEATAVFHPMQLLFYPDTPEVDQDTLIVIGLDTLNQDTQIQRMVFDNQAALLAQDPVETLGGQRIRTVCQVPDDATAG